MLLMPNLKFHSSGHSEWEISDCGISISEGTGIVPDKGTRVKLKSLRFFHLFIYYLKLFADSKVQKVILCTMSIQMLSKTALTLRMSYRYHVFQISIKWTIYAKRHFWKNSSEGKGKGGRFG